MLSLNTESLHWEPELASQAVVLLKLHGGTQSQ